MIGSVYADSLSTGVDDLNVGSTGENQAQEKDGLKVFLEKYYDDLMNNGDFRCSTPDDAEAYDGYLKDKKGRHLLKALDGLKKNNYEDCLKVAQYTCKLADRKRRIWALQLGKKLNFDKRAEYSANAEDANVVFDFFSDKIKILDAKVPKDAEALNNFSQPLGDDEFTDFKQIVRELCFFEVNGHKAEKDMKKKGIGMTESNPCALSNCRVQLSLCVICVCLTHIYASVLFVYIYISLSTKGNKEYERGEFLPQIPF